MLSALSDDLCTHGDLAWTRHQGELYDERRHWTRSSVSSIICDTATSPGGLEGPRKTNIGWTFSGRCRLSTAPCVCVWPAATTSFALMRKVSVQSTPPMAALKVTEKSTDDVINVVNYVKSPRGVSQVTKVQPSTDSCGERARALPRSFGSSLDCLYWPNEEKLVRPHPVTPAVSCVSRPLAPLDGKKHLRCWEQRNQAFKCVIGAIFRLN